MKTTHRQNLLAAALVCVLTVAATVAQAGEIGHYAPGVPNIRDFAVPEPGFYGAVYSYWYSTDRLNDRNGNKISSVTVNPGGGPGVTLGVDVNVDVYAVSPMFVWVSDWKFLGAKYAAYLAPSFASSSVGASLSAASGSGRSGGVSSEFGVGDLFVQPLRLGHHRPHRVDPGVSRPIHEPGSRRDHPPCRQHAVARVDQTFRPGCLVRLGPHHQSEGGRGRR
jgi:hypothetical protein